MYEKMPFCNVFNLDLYKPWYKTPTPLWTCWHKLGGLCDKIMSFFVGSTWKSIILRCIVMPFFVKIFFSSLADFFLAKCNLAFRSWVYTVTIFREFCPKISDFLHQWNIMWFDLVKLVFLNYSFSKNVFPSHVKMPYIFWAKVGNSGHGV